MLSAEQDRIPAPLHLPTGCWISLRTVDPIQSIIATGELSINDT